MLLLFVFLSLIELRVEMEVVSSLWESSGGGSRLSFLKGKQNTYDNLYAFLTSYTDFD